MRLNLRRIFKQYKPGDICTGAVHMFGLNSTQLSDDSKIDDGEYPLIRLGRDSYGNDQWIFDGYFER